MPLNTQSFTPSVAFHPGDTLTEKLSEMNMPTHVFAQHVQQTDAQIHAILNQTSGITPDLAERFEQELGIPTQFWLKKQEYFDTFTGK
jgi:HTH-type transcriptional regulator / antitoxin HigA